MSDHEIFDHFEIRKVLERYCRGVDRLDRELIDSVYWPEATDDHGPYKGPGKDFGEYLVREWTGRYRSTMHIIAQSNIRVDGDRAAADTYLIALHWSEVDGRAQVEKAFARYVDAFVKRAGEWRIMDRLVVMEHLQMETDFAETAWTLDDFERSRADRQDPSYRFLGI